MDFNTMNKNANPVADVKQEVKVSINTDFEEYMDDENFLPNVIAKIGREDLLDSINKQLNDSRFCADFYYDNATDVLINGYYNDIILAYHDFIIPKPPRVLEMIGVVQEIFDVEKVKEDDETLAFSVYLDEGPPAYTIEGVVNIINDTLGPRAKEKAAQLEKNDFTVIFNISAL